MREYFNYCSCTFFFKLRENLWKLLIILSNYGTCNLFQSYEFFKNFYHLFTYIFNYHIHNFFNQRKITLIFCQVFFPNLRFSIKLQFWKNYEHICTGSYWPRIRLDGHRFLIICISSLCSCTHCKRHVLWII